MHRLLALALVVAGEDVGFSQGLSAQQESRGLRSRGYDSSRDSTSSSGGGNMAFGLVVIVLLVFGVAVVKYLQQLQQSEVEAAMSSQTENYCGPISWLIGCFCFWPIVFCPVDRRPVPTGGTTGVKTVESSSAERCPDCGNRLAAGKTQDNRHHCSHCSEKIPYATNVKICKRCDHQFCCAVPPPKPGLLEKSKPLGQMVEESYMVQSKPLGLTAETTSGPAKITVVDGAGAAWTAGLRAGMIITRVNGTTCGLGVDGTWQALVQRATPPFVITCAIPASAVVEESYMVQSKPLGLTAETTSGPAKITMVDGAGAAWTAGLRAGMIITRVNGTTCGLGVDGTWQALVQRATPPFVITCAIPASDRKEVNPHGEVSNGSPAFDRKEVDPSGEVSAGSTDTGTPRTSEPGKEPDEDPSNALECPRGDLGTVSA